jgi:hypothetical protein
VFVGSFAGIAVNVVDISKGDLPGRVRRGRGGLTTDG